MNQNEKEIIVKIISSNGHDEKSFFNGGEAARFVKETAKNKNKWVFINGEARLNPETITPQEMIDAEATVLTNQITGG